MDCGPVVLLYYRGVACWGEEQAGQLSPIPAPSSLHHQPLTTRVWNGVQHPAATCSCTQEIIMDGEGGGGGGNSSVQLNIQSEEWTVTGNFHMLIHYECICLRLELKSVQAEWRLIWWQRDSKPRFITFAFSTFWTGLRLKVLWIVWQTEG